MNTKTILILGGVGLAAYYLFMKPPAASAQSLAQQQAAQAAALRLAQQQSAANNLQSQQTGQLISAGTSLLQTIINPPQNSGDVDMYGQDISPTGMYGVNKKNII